MRRVVSVAEVVRIASGPAARELYAWRDGAPRWRAAMTDALAARLDAAGPPPLGAAGDGAAPRVPAAGDAGAVPRAGDDGAASRVVSPGLRSGDPLG